MGTSSDAPKAPPERTAPSRRRKILRALAVACVLILLVLVGTVWFAQSRLTGKIDHVDGAMPLASVPRADAAPAGSQTILLLGSDKRVDGSVAGQRSDTMMLVNVAANRKTVSVVSIPRDSWVDVPGHGMAKINAAFSWGGTALTIQTLEQMTHVRIDHVATIDFEGFKDLSTALGGVKVTVADDSYDAYNKKTWKAGTYSLQGREALLYVRQRAGLPGGDFDRVKRQQNFLRSALNEMLSTDTFTNPVRLYRSLDAITSNLSVDADWSSADLRSLALSLRSVRSGDVRFATIPVTGTGMEGAQSVVYIDRPAAASLWKAYASDRVAAWITKNEAALPAAVD